MEKSDLNIRRIIAVIFVGMILGSCEGAGQNIGEGPVQNIGNILDPIIPDLWSHQTLGGRGTTFQHIAYGMFSSGEHVFIAVGTDGAIYRSTDAFIWEKVVTGDGSPLLRVVYGDGIFMGFRDSDITRSMDKGKTWENLLHSLPRLRSLVYGEMLVEGTSTPAFAASFIHSVYLSTAKGENWKDITPSGFFPPPSNFNTLSYGSDKLLLQGDSSTSSVDIYRSGNGGDSWDKVVLISPPIPNFYFSQIISRQDTFIALKQDGGIYYGEEGDPWAFASGSGTIVFRDVEYGASEVVVAVGNAGNIYRSTDGGKIWSEIPTSATEKFTDITYGRGIFVAVGAPNGVIYSSADEGVNWVSVPGTRFEGFADVAYGDHTFVIAGNEGSIYHRLNTENAWTSIIMDSNVPPFPSSTNFLGVTYGKSASGEGVFVVVGRPGAIYRSTNGGEIWEPTSITPPSSTSFLGVTYGKSASGEEVFVAVGNNGGIYHSVDGGKVWNPSTNITPPFVSTFSGVTHGTSSSGEEIFVVVGDSGGIYYSTDGKSWTKADQGSRTNHLADIDYGSNIFVAVGSLGEIYYSTDGDLWTKADQGARAKSLVSVAYGGGTFVTAGDDGDLHYSMDGKVWKKIVAPIFKSFKGVGYGERSFVVVGDGAVLTYP